MTDKIIESPANIQPDGQTGRKKKPGRPRVPPACESKPQEYEHCKVVWGIHAVYPQFKQKGIAVLHKESEGDMVVLMPVGKDKPEDPLRWRYRKIPGPAPYQYAMIDLEPEQGYKLGDILIELGTALKEGVKEWFGSVEAAAKTSEDYVKTVKNTELGDKIRKEHPFG